MDQPFGARSDIMTPVPDATIADLAGIEAMRALGRSVTQLSDQMGRQDGKLEAVHEFINEMRVWIAEQRKDNQSFQEVRGDVTLLKGRVEKLETTQAEQRGWRQMINGFGWLLGLVGVVYGFLGGKHP